MKIETKYNIGDYVYTLDVGQVREPRKCWLCLGEGKLFKSDSTPVDCTNCRGTGIIGSTEFKNHWSVDTKKHRVSHIKVLAQRGLANTHCRFALTGSWIHEDNLFSSLEKAQERCDKCNGEK